MPALKAITGMAASMAFFTVGAIAGGSGRVTAMPSTLLSIALWMRVACFPESGSEEYLSVTLSLAAAAWAPLRMMSQNVSLGAPWVTMAIVMFGVLALPALAVWVFSSDFLPPELLQAAAARSSITVTTASRGWCRSRVMACLSVWRPGGR
jgi:hypothetical protein